MRRAPAWAALLAAVLAGNLLPGSGAGGAAAAHLASGAEAGGAQGRVLDDFASIAAWSAHPSDGVTLAISRDSGRRPEGGGAMRLDFDFRGHAGYAIARRQLDLELPANYEVSFGLRGAAPVENLELKLLDATGDNVWWMNRRNFSFPPSWRRISTRKRQISFAWGPAGGGEIHRLAAIEIVVTAATGGKGTVWIDELALTELPPAAGPVTRGAWRGGEGALALTIDLGGLREVGGLHIRWDPSDFARDFAVDLSRDGERYSTAREVVANGRRDELLFLPDEEARLVRLTMRRSSRGEGFAIELVEVEPPEWAQTANEFFAAVAKAAPRGDYPRYLAGEQPYWTVVGADGGQAKALVGEDGNVEPYQAGFSIEPFVVAGGRVFSWRDAEPRQSLAEGDLPIPTVTWTLPGMTLEITAAVTDSSMLLLRYRARGAGGTRRTAGAAAAAAAAASAADTSRQAAASWRQALLCLAVRPFQVNPATQFLNTPGGVAPIHAIELDLSDRRSVIVDGARRVRALQRPRSFIAAAYDEGEIADLLRREGDNGAPSAAGRAGAPGSQRGAARRRDPFGYASGALIYRLGATREIDLEVALEPGARPVADVAAEMRRIARQWRAKLDRVAIVIPGAPQIAATVRSSLAWTLIHRRGAALEPGSRAYDRAWIRDGALISSILLRLGHASAARRFAAWFAPYQYEDGKVPCCVDRRGADPVPENDSHGELIYLVAEIERLTHDLAFVRRLWPHVDAAARYIGELSRRNHGPFEGLVTESISHEGYSAKPVHSFWDDLFALKGLDDAAYLAGRLRLGERRRELAAQAAAFRRDFEAALRRTIALHRLDFVPGSAELGDFDATSTAIGISPLGLGAVFPPAELRRTFDRYLESLAAPRAEYTPYEMRIIGALFRRGERERALPLLDRFLADRRPAPWNEWAEVVGAEARQPRFIGDMPHAWVASDFIRSVLDAVAYDREDGALVVGAGVPRSWLGGGTLHVGPLPTYGGTIDLRMRTVGGRPDQPDQSDQSGQADQAGQPAQIIVELRGSDLPGVPAMVKLPAARPAWLIVCSPDERPLRAARVNGRAVAHAGREVVVARLPARVVFEY
ncbi:MAG TPA: discoidin domain-containing protein [Thermoanaerobaculia bacterium]|nr:discoidin domain-containing protein [Thermoanaerobaculia bacterium]